MPPHHRHSLQGFSLIEALVTLVIIGLGVLAAAGLQIGARKGQQEASQRTAASAIIQDLAARMQGNPEGRDTYINALKISPNAFRNGLAPAAKDCQAAGSCSPADVAQADLGRWWAGLTGTGVTTGDGASTPVLDQPTVCLCQRTGASNDYFLTLAWRGAGPAGSFAQEDGVKFGLTCGDNDSQIQLYDDPDTDPTDISLRRTETVHIGFSNIAAGTPPPSGVPPCAS